MAARDGQGGRPLTVAIRVAVSVCRHGRWRAWGENDVPDERMREEAAEFYCDECGGGEPVRVYIVACDVLPPGIPTVAGFATEVIP